MSYIATFTPETLSRTDVDALRGPLVLEFGRNDCGWCQRAQPLIEAAFIQAGAQVPHVKIEDGRGRPLGRSYGIKLWPTLVFLHHGVEVARLVRPQQAHIVIDALMQLEKLSNQ
ncbi:thioredoxin family protein [Ottowia sp.]|uniref:thioredoxin family protein n=1 Tax=Ottowia sp. TaxID=1898956 RepID=UPI003A8C07F0